MGQAHSKANRNQINILSNKLKETIMKKKETVKKTPKRTTKKSSPTKPAVKKNTAPKSTDFESTNLDEFKFRLDDVIGQDQAVEELKELLHNIKEKEFCNVWGIRPVNGILLTGSPGTGKTMAARALTKELGCDAIMMELKYRDIASRWIDAPIEHLSQFFKIVELKARDKHVIVFIDEIDSMLPDRSSLHLHESSVKRVDVFLEWLDGGLTSLKNVTVIGATNFINGVDRAALRPGRF